LIVTEKLLSLLTVPHDPHLAVLLPLPENTMLVAPAPLRARFPLLVKLPSNVQCHRSAEDVEIERSSVVVDLDVVDGGDEEDASASETCPEPITSKMPLTVRFWPDSKAVLVEPFITKLP